MVLTPSKLEQTLQIIAKKDKADKQRSDELYSFPILYTTKDIDISNKWQEIYSWRTSNPNATRTQYVSAILNLKNQLYNLIGENYNIYTSNNALTISATANWETRKLPYTNTLTSADSSLKTLLYSFDPDTTNERLPKEISLGGYTVLTNIGTTYDAINQANGLGIANLNFTDVNQLDFIVRTNKIGTGNQSWQLWNDTTSSQITVITDSGAAGNKTLLASGINVATITGINTVRIRAKSDVSSDDPLYYGSSIKLSY